MSKTIEIPDIAQYEKNDSALAKYTIGELTKENIALKKQLDMLVKDDEKQQKIIIALQQRVYKAIEYMNNTFDITSVKELFEILNKVEDILRGEDNE